jgi:hypothetical protein
VKALRASIGGEGDRRLGSRAVAAMADGRRVHGGGKGGRARGKARRP